ncbi:MAG: translation initiation factor IF-3, partial [Patescibacteria group bacterium]|nr:translation initiation factor IF-3 [Patescibacteria group bacterium]
QIGVMTRDEAIFKARQMNMDLILVADKAKPPVARIIDFNKFKYIQSQKAKEGKKKTVTANLKEVRITPFIAQGDFATRMKRVKQFLGLGHKVKLTVKFTGRQISRKAFGEQLLHKSCQEVVEYGTQESQPKWQGKLLWVTFSPIKKSKKDVKEK